MVALTTLIEGQTGIIQSLTSNLHFNARLKALGFKKNSLVKLIRKAKYNGPFHLRIGATEIMVRANIAEQIIIKSLTNSK
jgi:ferrous iron transport protein A